MAHFFKKEAKLNNLQTTGLRYHLFRTISYGTRLMIEILNPEWGFYAQNSFYMNLSLKGAFKFE